MGRDIFKYIRLRVPVFNIFKDGASTTSPGSIGRHHCIPLPPPPTATSLHGLSTLCCREKVSPEPQTPPEMRHLLWLPRVLLCSCVCSTPHLGPATRPPDDFQEPHLLSPWQISLWLVFHPLHFFFLPDRALVFPRQCVQSQGTAGRAGSALPHRCHRLPA